MSNSDSASNPNADQTERATADVGAGGAGAADGADLKAAIGLAVVLVAAPAVLIGVLLFALIPGPWWIGVLLGLLIAAAVVFHRAQNADHAVVSKLGGGLLQADGEARLTNLVQGLSLAGGVAEPDLMVLSDRAMNAMAVQRSGRNQIVVTQGLLQSLEVVELEGVVAELLTRLKNGDAEAATVGAALFGQTILDGPLAPVLRPVATSALGRLLQDDRDLEADRQAVSLTRYPPGLHAAFVKIGAGDVTPASHTVGTAHLWLIEPDGAAMVADSGRASLDLRRDVLAEL